jgi:hypothetical protein
LQYYNEAQDTVDPIRNPWMMLCDQQCNCKNHQDVKYRKKQIKRSGSEYPYQNDYETYRNRLCYDYYFFVINRQIRAAHVYDRYRNCILSQE